MGPATTRIEPSISGTSALDLRHGFETLVGRDVVADAVSTLPPEHRRRFEEATAISWVPIATIGLVHDAVAARSQRNANELLDEAVRIAAARSFKTVWRALLRFTSDEALIARTPLMYARTRNIGRLEVESFGAGRATLRLHDWPDISDRNLRSLAVSIETVLQLCGRPGARVAPARTAANVTLMVSWRG